MPPKGSFDKNPTRYINLFAGSVANHKSALESINELSEDTPSLELNRVLPGSGKIGFISSSINYLYLLEALSLLGITDAPVLKIGLSYPLNGDEVLSFVSNLERVYIVEDLEGFLEFQIKGMLYDSNTRVQIIGKEIFPKYGELDVDLISSILEGELKRKLPPRIKKAEELSEKFTKDIPPRQGSFCTGCPHRSTLYSIVKATDRKVIFAGDIGCYTLSCLPPFRAFDWVTCMNCGVGIGQGILQKIEGEDMLAYVGDSTFFHSGLPNLINAVEQGVNMVLVILDNKWVAMTGHQPSPTTVSTTRGEKLKPVDIKGLLKSIGVQYIRTVNPHNIKASIVAIKDAIRAKDGVRVVIADQECALQQERRAKLYPTEYDVYYQIDPERCQKCNECYVEFGCPAIRRVDVDDDFHYYIEEAACIHCGACHDLCLNSAILRTEIHRLTG